MTSDTKNKAKPPKPNEMPPEVLEFIQAMDDYKRIHSRPFPNWSEVLGVVKVLGYQKVIS